MTLNDRSNLHFMRIADRPQRYCRMNRKFVHPLTTSAFRDAAPSKAGISAVNR
jgi:hypothetical protein